MPSSLLRRPLRATAAALLAFGTAAVAEERIAVKVDKSGQRVVLDVVVHVDAPAAHAWSVFTDYDGMSAFLRTSAGAPS